MFTTVSNYLSDYQKDFNFNLFYRTVHVHYGDLCKVFSVHTYGNLPNVRLHVRLYCTSCSAQTQLS